MSHSSDPDQPARRRTTVVLVLAVLMAVVGGVLSITPTTGTASAWVEPPLELADTTPDEAVHPIAPEWPGRTVPDDAGSSPLAAAASGFRSTTARQTVAMGSGDDPPPGRSPPRH